MSKKTIILLVIIAALLITVPTLAKKEVVGERISLLCASEDPACLTKTFPADEPFYIMHGWASDALVSNINKYDFTLEVDGVQIPYDYRDRTITSKKPKATTILNVYLFPEGMTGTHVFTATWFALCQDYVNAGLIPGPCSNPNELIETGSWDVTITFTP